MFPTKSALVASVAVGLMAALTSRAEAAAPVVRFCSGKTGLNYDYAAMEIAKRAKPMIDVQIINTAGSLENLSKLDNGECDVAIVQSDAEIVYAKQNQRSALNIERGRVLYPEYLHFICNTASGITRVTQLTSKNMVLIGPNGGGTSVTWESFKQADPKRYGPVQTGPLDGQRALSKVQGGTDASCMMLVTGLKSSAMMQANTLASQTPGRMVLVPVDDKDLPGVKDPKGQAMYTRTSIPEGTYRKGLQPTGTFGGTDSIGSISVDAVFVANVNFIERNEKLYDVLLTAVNNASPTISDHVTVK